MEYSEIIKLVADLGVSIVCSGVVVYLFIELVKRATKQNEELISFIQTCKTNDHPGPKDSDNSDIINEKITEILAYVLNDTHADRCYLYLYHNGGRSTSGLSFQRMSCTCEVIAPGILPVASDGQNLHKGSYYTLCKMVRENGRYYVPDVSVLEKTDTMTYYRTQMRHIESLYLRGVKDIDGYTIGFIGLDYCSVNRKTDEKIIDRCMTNAVTRISSLVDIKTSI